MVSRPATVSYWGRKMPLDGLTPINIAALLFFLISWIGYAQLLARGVLAGRGVVARMDHQRQLWMKNMAGREMRMVDTQITGMLAQGNAFFASTSVFIIAGLVTILGSTDEALALLKGVPYIAADSRLLWEAKLVLMIAIFTYAFFKFAWAYRQTLYVAISIGATPELKEDNQEECYRQAALCARLASLVAYHHNAGLRAYYFGIAVLSWFIHAAVFMAATAIVVYVVFRRENRSRAFRALGETVVAPEWK